MAIGFAAKPKLPTNMSGSGQLFKTTFDQVRTLGKWVAINNCPGRFVLREVPATFSVTDLLGESASIQQFQCPGRRDEVWIVCFEDGGTISYHRPDGTWLHTLNTKEGMRRKLDLLGISANT